MPPRVSVAMLQARKLMATGVSAAEAARVTGLTKGAISQDAICKKHALKAKNAKKTD